VNQLTAKKKFGQNFLVDAVAQQKVVLIMRQLVDVYKDRFILEIGPGQGDLTQFILDFGKPLLALEIDPEAVDLLKEKFGARTNFELIKTDAAKIIVGQGPVSSKLLSPFVLLSSLPYNVGSRILVDLAIHFPDTPFAVILQKEVIEKVVRRETFTFFGAWLSIFWNLKNHLDIHPHSFSPQPKVTSGLMIGIPETSKDLANVLATIEQRITAKDTLKQLFANPSKTLANNLKNLGWDNPKIETFFNTHSLDPKIRLSWDNYVAILEAVLGAN
jgi:16S rRNA (adenine1518-N6/adenine1519-N6)-dimethyltransferase